MIIAGINIFFYVLAIIIALRDGDASLANLYDSTGLWFSLAIVSICWRLDKLIELNKKK